MSSSNIDLNKFLSEPNDIIKRLYEETEIGILTQEEFENLPLNELYIANKKKKEEETNNRVEEILDDEKTSN